MKKNNKIFIKIAEEFFGKYFFSCNELACKSCFEELNFYKELYRIANIDTFDDKYLILKYGEDRAATLEDYKDIGEIRVLCLCLAQAVWDSETK